MSTPAALPPLREIIDRYGLRAKKSLGQNFLLDLNLCDRIVREARISESTHVYEVGPGPGGLTRSLLAAGALVTAVEKDSRCLEALGELKAVYPDQLNVIQGDAMEIDESQLFFDAQPQIVANLPYNVASLLLARWLSLPEWPPFYAGMTLMFQKEVAERITAPPGSRTYGRLSVLSQWRTEPRILLTLPPRAFVPPPKVTSAVVGFRPRETPLAPAPGKLLNEVVAAAFNQRRKMLRSGLKALGVETSVLLEKAGVDPERRAEMLSVEEFCALARALEEMR